MHINTKWLRYKARRKEGAVNTTGWNSYSIHDFEALHARLTVQHKAKQAVAAKLGQPVPSYFEFYAAVAQNTARFRRHRGDTSKYSPHQGKQECARRVRMCMNHGL